MHSRSLPAALHQASSACSLAGTEGRRLEHDPHRSQSKTNLPTMFWGGGMPPQNPGPSGPPHPLRLPLLERGEGLSPLPLLPPPLSATMRGRHRSPFGLPSRPPAAEAKPAILIVVGGKNSCRWPGGCPSASLKVTSMGVALNSERSFVTSPQTTWQSCWPG